MITHPVDENRKLFLSFDQCHILKNIRNQFLEREMTDGSGDISGKYLKLLYKLQKDEIVKPVRNLTKKHIEPTAFEKMNVRRAKELFSPSVIAAISALKENSLVHPQAYKFKDAEATLTFMTNINRWFIMHDISNTYHHIHGRNQDKMQFLSINDNRLEWLLDYFIPYLDTMKAAGNQLGKEFLTNETFEALVLTTRSTVDCIKYLLQNGYHYILTRAFSSDPVESLFSTLRQMSGSNDMMDARSVSFSLQKILKTGILSSSDFSNVEERTTSITEGPFQSLMPPDTATTEYTFPEQILIILEELLQEPRKLNQLTGIYKTCQLLLIIQV